MVVVAMEGGVAISQARAEVFDAAVLVSTGREMGLAATALNLRAVRADMSIVIVAGFGEAGQTHRLCETVTSVIPNTRLLDIAGLGSFFRGPAEMDVLTEQLQSVSKFARRRNPS